MFKKLVFALSLTSCSPSYSFILDFFKDVGNILGGIEEMNRQNRAAFFEIVINNATNRETHNEAVEENKTSTTSPEKMVTRKPKIQKPTGPFTFKNLAGDIPEDVVEVVDFLKNAHHFIQVGAEMPKGVLLVGPPGTGKTSIARAIAGEAEANFFDASGSQFIEMYVGVGPKRIRELFTKARNSIKRGPYKKAVIFIDEIDAIGGARGDVGGGNSEYRNTLNELLNQMDGFTQDGSILVIGATNTPNSLDSALKRPGRFDRIVEIKLPDVKSREAILKLYSKNIAAVHGINFKEIAEKANNFTGADLKNLINEAAVRAARQKKTKVTQDHFDTATRDLIKRKKQETYL